MIQKHRVLSFNSMTGSNKNGDNAFKLHTSISGAAVINSNNGFAKEMKREYNQHSIS